MDKITARPIQRYRQVTWNLPWELYETMEVLRSNLEMQPDEPQSEEEFGVALLTQGLVLLHIQLKAKQAQEKLVQPAPEPLVKLS